MAPTVVGRQGQDSEESSNLQDLICCVDPADRKCVTDFFCSQGLTTVAEVAALGEDDLAQMLELAGAELTVEEHTAQRKLLVEARRQVSGEAEEDETTGLVSGLPADSGGVAGRSAGHSKQGARPRVPGRRKTRTRTAQKKQSSGLGSIGRCLLGAAGGGLLVLLGAFVAGRSRLASAPMVASTSSHQLLLASAAVEPGAPSSESVAPVFAEPPAPVVQVGRAGFLPDAPVAHRGGAAPAQWTPPFLPAAAAAADAASSQSVSVGGGAALTPAAVDGSLLPLVSSAIAAAERGGAAATAPSAAAVLGRGADGAAPAVEPSAGGLPRGSAVAELAHAGHPAVAAAAGPRPAPADAAALAAAAAADARGASRPRQRGGRELRRRRAPGASPAAAPRQSGDGARGAGGAADHRSKSHGGEGVSTLESDGRANFSKYCKLYPQKRVVLVTVNTEYLEFFKNWFHFAKSHLKATEQLRVVAEDEGVLAPLEEMQRASVQVASVQFDLVRPRRQLSAATKPKLQYGSEAYGEVVWKRPKHLLEVLSANCSVLYVDIDTAWRKDPFLPIAHAAFGDLYLTRDNIKLPEEQGYCTCFMYMNPTSATKLLMSSWSSARVPGSKVNQPYFCRMLRNFSTASGLKKVVLPIDQFPPGREAHLYKDATVVHANWRKGLDKKVKFMKEHHLWNPRGS